MPAAISGQRVCVVHAGALGDSIMLWPLLRALNAHGAGVTFVTHASKAALAARMLGVVGASIDTPLWDALWHDEPTGGSIAAIDERTAFGTVFCALLDGDDAVSDRWAKNAKRVLGAKRVVCVGSPGSPTRAELWRSLDVARLGIAPARDNPSGPIVLHVGSGGAGKSWEMLRWTGLTDALRDRSETVQCIAGEVEQERMTTHDREQFDHMDGRFIASLDELADSISRASVFVGVDTGPTHLAAQLGVRTLALFGPTDPGVWAPIGPRAGVLAPATPCAMSWLSVNDVLRSIELLT